MSDFLANKKVTHFGSKILPFLFPFSFFCAQKQQHYGGLTLLELFFLEKLYEEILAKK